MPPRQPARRLVRPETAPTPQEIPTVGIPFPVYRYRVLFTDGQTVDYLSYADHSGIRGQMLDQHFGKRPKTKPGESLEGIAGIAHLGEVYVHTPAAP